MDEWRRRTASTAFPLPLSFFFAGGSTCSACWLSSASLRFFSSAFFAFFFSLRSFLLRSFSAGSTSLAACDAGGSG